MDKKTIIGLYNEHIFPAITHFYETPLIISKGKNQYLYDIDGNEYLDFFGGILTVSIGHCNEEVTQAVCEQIATLQHTSTIYLNTPMVRFAHKLAEIAPGNLNKCFFTNSGTEANETAILAAKITTGRQEIITLRHSYHGRSMMTMSASGHADWKLGGTHVPGFKHAHNGYCYRCAFGLTYPACDMKCARDIEELIVTETSGGIAGFLAEPIQGVGGFITPPKEYFSVAYEIVKKYGGLFISDEVQTGFGRTGDTWWGIEQYSVQPDMITCAKGIANGVPCGATVATDEIAESLQGKTISTFGGNPVTSTAGYETIAFMERHNLKKNAKECGDYLCDRLKELQEKYPIIGEVRGMGLMQAIELAGENKEPAAKETSLIMEKTREYGLLIGKAGLYGNVIRLSPPLTVGRSDIDAAIDALDRSFSAVLA